MNPVRRFAIASATAALLGGLASPTLAADSVTVEASVEIVGPCLTTSTPTVDFGQMEFGTAGLAPVAYQNCSAVTEHVYARGTGASDLGATRTGWSLSDAGIPCPDRGPNAFGLATDSLLLLGESDREIDEVPAGSPGAVAGLVLYMPCAGSDGLGSVMTWQVIFTATF